MAGEVKGLQFSQGTEVLASPLKIFLSATSTLVFADDAAYVAAKTSAAAIGDHYMNSTTKKLRVHDGVLWRDVNTTLDNFTASAPTANEDSGDNYEIGSKWLDTSTGIWYIANSVGVGAAVWKQLLDTSSAQDISGVKTITNTTQSTDKDTGALVIEGGVGIEKNLNVGGSGSFTGALSVLDTTEATDKDTGCLVLQGGLGVEKNAYIGGNLVVTGDLTINGTTTTINTTVLEVEDANITINNGGNQASANNTAGLTVEMSDATHAKLVYSSGLTSRFKIGDSGSESEIVTVGHAQTMTLKTFNDEITMQEITTPATPAAGYQKLYPKTDGLWYAKNDAGTELPLGSGGGDFNFLQYKVITDFVAYDDSGDVGYVAGLPVDGTGGSPSTITIAAAASPINTTAGVLNIDFSKSAANGQGQGMAVAFTTRGDIDKAAVRVCKINIMSSANYIDNDCGIYLFDTVNSRIIYPADQNIKASSFVSQQQFEFQLSPDSTSYRLITHVQSTNANAYTLTMTVGVYETKTSTGGIVNWPSYTMTVTGADSWVTKISEGIPYKTINGDWRLRFNVTGDVSSATRTSYVATISGINATSSDVQAITAYSSSSTATVARGWLSGAGVMTITHASAATVTYWFSGDIALTEKPSWAVDYSNQVLSEDAGNRSIGGTAFRATNQTGIPSATTTQVLYNSTTAFQKHPIDNCAAFNLAGSYWEILESGDYFVDACFRVDSANTTTGNAGIGIYVGTGTFAAALAAGPEANKYTNRAAANAYDDQLSKILSLVKGDRVFVGAYLSNSSTGTIRGTTGYNATTYFNIKKLASPQQIAASEKVYARYESNVAQSIATASSSVTGVHEDKVIDTHNAYNPSTGVFTAPRSGMLTMSSNTSFANSTGWEVGERARHVMQIAGVNVRYMGENVVSATAANYIMQVGGKASYPIIKGQTAELKIYQNSDAALSTDADPAVNWVEFTIE